MVSPTVRLAGLALSTMPKMLGWHVHVLTRSTTASSKYGRCGSRGAVRLLQAATPFGLAGAGASRATANAQAVAAARCYLLDAEGTLREVSARAR